MTENTIDCLSILNPNVNDDCEIIAYAPLDEPSSPDELVLKSVYPEGPIYNDQSDPSLLLLRR